jgi:hypothetical protein
MLFHLLRSGVVAERRYPVQHPQLTELKGDVEDLEISEERPGVIAV